MPPRLSIVRKTQTTGAPVAGVSLGAAADGVCCRRLPGSSSSSPFPVMKTDDRLRVRTRRGSHPRLARRAERRAGRPARRLRRRPPRSTG